MKFLFMRLKVLTATTLNMTVFWYVVRRSFDRRFGRSVPMKLRGKTSQKTAIFSHSFLNKVRLTFTAVSLIVNVCSFRYYFLTS
jgi:hypothetical protein